MNVLTGSSGLGTNSLRFFSQRGAQALEEDSSMPIARAGNLKSLALNAWGNTLDQPAIFTVCHNSAPTPITLTIPPGANGLFTATGTETTSPGDRASLKGDSTGSTLGAVYFTFSVEHAPTP